MPTDYALTTPTTRWTAEAAAYDKWFDQPWGHHATIIEHGMLLDAAGPLAGCTVIDAGCGTGRFMRHLESERALTTGIDLDPDAIAIARSRTSGPLLRADISSIPFTDCAVDIAFAVTVCEFTSDPTNIVAELVRITRPGGRVVVGSLNRKSPWGWWNRRQFKHPPWDTARLLDRRTLLALGAPHGRCVLRAGLFEPRSLPMIEPWSPAVEHLGRRFAPSFGAFQVLTIHIPQPGKQPDPPTQGPQP